MAVENLSTARVLVVDDKPEEAVPILTALGEIGVGCIYVKGDKEEELPEEPIEGIRLVFLDMRLDEAGDQKSVLSKTIGVLKRCVPETTMPLVVVCWTKHEEDVQVFRTMAIEDISGLKPGFIMGMPKPVEENPEEWRDLLQGIRNILDQYDAVGVIWQWERVLHAAATGTSQALAEVSARLVKDDPTALDWQEEMLKVCRELVRTDVGKTGSRNTATNALFRVMNELAMDRIQHSVLKNPVACADKLVPGRQSDLGLEPISILNQMILVEPVEKSDRTIKPGNIYAPLTSGSKKCLFEKLGVNLKELWDNIAHEKADDSVSPVLIEVSPLCDYAQNKRPVCTFIAGYLLPAGKTWEKMRGEHLYFFDPLILPKESEAKRIVVSKRYVYASALKQRDISNQSICRLRSNILVDLQARLAAYKSRPGIMALQHRGRGVSEDSSKGQYSQENS